MRDHGLFFSSSSRRGGAGGGRGADEARTLGALRSPWITRLRPPPRPPPRPRSLLLPAAERDAAAEAARSARGGGAVSNPESRTRDFLVRRYSNFSCGEPPPPPLPLSAVASGAPSSSSYMQQQQQREAEAGHWSRRGEVAQEGEGDCMLASFGPFQVRAKRARLLVAEGPKQQQEHSESKLDGEKAGGSRGSGRLVAGAFPGRSLVGDGCFPLFRRMARLGGVRGDAGEVAERYGGKEGWLVEDEGERELGRRVTGQRVAVQGERCRLWDTSSSLQRGTLCTYPNIGMPGEMGSDNAAGSSQIIKNNQWFHHHRWGDSSKSLDHYPASSSWSVGNGSIIRPQVSGSGAGPRGVTDEVSHQRLHDQNFMSSAQGYH